MKPKLLVALLMSLVLLISTVGVYAFDRDVGPPFPKIEKQSIEPAQIVAMNVAEELQIVAADVGRSQVYKTDEVRKEVYNYYDQGAVLLTDFKIDKGYRSLAGYELIFYRRLPEMAYVLNKPPNRA